VGFLAGYGEIDRNKVVDVNFGQKFFYPTSNPTLEKTLSVGKTVYSLLQINSERIVVGIGASVEIWNLNTGQYEKKLGSYHNSVNSLIRLQDNKIALRAFEGKAEVWNLDTWKCERTLSNLNGAHSAEVSITSLQDTRVALVCNQDIKIWNLNTGQYDLVLPYEKAAGNVCSLLQLSDGRIASGHSGIIKIWNINLGYCEKILSDQNTNRKNSSVWSLLQTSSEQLVSGHVNGTINIWNLKSGQCENVLSGHHDRIHNLIPLADGRFASGSSDETIKIWNIKNGKCENTLSAQSYVNVLIQLSDGRLASGNHDATIKLWNIYESRNISKFDLLEALKKLKTNTSVENISLRGLKLDSEIVETLVASLKMNKTIKTIDLSETVFEGNPKPLLDIAKTNLQIKMILPSEINMGIHEEEKKLEKQMKKPMEKEKKPNPPTIDNNKTNTAPVEEKEKEKEDNDLKPNPPTIDDKKITTASPIAEKKTNTAPDPHAELTSYQIVFSKLTFDKELGQGGFGVVYKGTYNNGDIAVKKLLIKNMSPDTEKEFKNEVTAMIKSKHPNIITFFGYCKAPTYCIIMELMMASLYAVLHDSDKNLDWNLRLQIAKDVMAGICHLHGNKILHRDVKSLNILLDKDMRAKLSDFGLAKVRSETSSTTKGGEKAMGTPAWMAPEILSLHPKYSEKSDIYACGMVFWEISSRQDPYAGVDVGVMKDEVKKGEREEIPKDCPVKFAALIKSCWAGDPEKRPTAEVVFKGLNQ
jgi:WD40 repeat protein